MAKKENDPKVKKEMEVEMVFKGVDLIKDAVKIAYSLQTIAGLEPCDIITTAVLAMGDVIVSFADSTGAPREKVLKMFVDCLKDHVRNAEKPKAKEVKM